MYHHQKIHMLLSIAVEHHEQSDNKKNQDFIQKFNVDVFFFTSSNFPSSTLYRNTVNDFIKSLNNTKSSLILTCKQSICPKYCVNRINS
jgi:hypothetical protein